MIVSLCLLILCLAALRQNNVAPLVSKRPLTDWAKFVAALLVVNGHLFLFEGGPADLAREMNLGTLCVSLFLFFSGYGLMNSYEAKGRAYFRNFLPHRIGRVLLPLLTAYLVSLPVYRIFVGPIDWHLLVSTIGWGGPYLKFSWYVTEIVALYLLFYATMRPQVETNRKLIVLTACVVLAMGIMAVSRQPLWYIVSLPAFVMGVWFRRWEHRFAGFSSKTVLAIVLIASAAFLITFRWDMLAERVEALALYRYQYASSYLVNIFFVVLAVVVIRGNFPPPRSRLTECFYEIYLLQNAVMIAFRGVTGYFPLYWLCVMVFTVAAAWVMHGINARLIRLLRI